MVERPQPDHAQALARPSRPAPGRPPPWSRHRCSAAPAARSRRARARRERGAIGVGAGDEQQQAAGRRRDSARATFSVPCRLTCQAAAGSCRAVAGGGDGGQVHQRIGRRRARSPPRPPRRRSHRTGRPRSRRAGNWPRSAGIKCRPTKPVGAGDQDAPRRRHAQRCSRARCRARSASTISATISASVDLRRPAQPLPRLARRRRAARRPRPGAGGAGRAGHGPRSSARHGRTPAGRTRGCWSCARSRSRSRPARPAAASATSPARSRAHGPSRAWRPDCRARSSRARPSLMRATPSVTLRVTNSMPRSGLSWLNRMPLLACRPKLSR